MGTVTFDAFTILHLVMGAAARYISMPLGLFLGLSVAYEIFENTDPGYALFQKYDHLIPGGKRCRDSLHNSVVDILFGLFGFWLVDSLLRLDGQPVCFDPPDRYWETFWELS